jgi:hypothetical protein
MEEVLARKTLLKESALELGDAKSAAEELQEQLVSLKYVQDMQNRKVAELNKQVQRLMEDKELPLGELAILVEALGAERAVTQEVMEARRRIASYGEVYNNQLRELDTLKLQLKQNKTDLALFQGEPSPKGSIKRKGDADSTESGRRVRGGYR